MEVFILGGIGALILVAGCVVFGLWLGRRSRAKPLEVQTQMITERVRSVGKLVGFEVFAKEITTAKQGVNWMHPALVSQSRLAMIFHFEKQYYIDLEELRPEDIREVGPKRFRIVLPPVRGDLVTRDFEMYDISSGRVLGLIEVNPMSADRQNEMKRVAQQQAAHQFYQNDGKYEMKARTSLERTLSSLAEMLGAELEFEWAAPKAFANQQAAQQSAQPASGTAPAQG